MLELSTWTWVIVLAIAALLIEVVLFPETGG